MKKNALLLFALLFSVNSWAQNAHIEEVATSTAQKHCDCVNKTYTFIDKDVAAIIIETGKADSKKEVAKILSSLGEEMMQKFIEQSKLLNNPEITALYEECLKGMKSKIEQLTAEDKELISQAKFMQLVVNKLGGNKNCELAAVILEKELRTRE